MRTSLRSFLVITLLSAAPFSGVLRAQSQLEIVAAYWGNGNNFADVTPRVRSLVQGNGLDVPVSVRSMGVDPLPGAGKILRVYYLQNGQFNQGEWRENMTARIATGGRGGAGDRGRDQGDRGRDSQGDRGGRQLPLRVTFAAYGLGNQVADVTRLMQSRVANNRLDIVITNQEMGGDPAPNVAKNFHINYEWAGRAYEVVIKENEVLHLPDADGAPPMAVAPALQDRAGAIWLECATGRRDRAAPEPDRGRSLDYASGEQRAGRRSGTRRRQGSLRHLRSERPAPGKARRRRAAIGASVGFRMEDGPSDLDHAREMRKAEIERLAQDLPDEILNKDLLDLELSVRASNGLYDRNLLTVGAILKTTRKQLIGSGYGRNSFREVNEILQEIDPRLSIGCLALDP